MTGKHQINQIVSRLRQLRQTMRDRGLDGFLATDPQDVSYLSGFSGDDSYLLVTGRGAALITDSRYLEQARQECPRLAVIQRKGPLAVAVAHRARRVTISRIGLEPAGLSLEAYKQLGRAIGRRKLIDAQGLVRRMRIRKDVREQAAMRRAIKVAEEAFLVVLDQLRAGITELEVAGRLDFEMKLRGASEPAFSTIVACGPRSSMPHAQPGNIRIKPNQPVLIDWGATVAGYRCDLTRVVFLDSMSQSLRAAYQSVLEAGRAGLEAVKPGVSAKQVDEAARAVIRKAGYGAYFGHGLGHGIGRNVHEAPSISRKSQDVLEEGMIFTIEPGIYLPRRGGIRIENDVLVTKRGCRVLSGLPDEQNWAVRK
ncbi:MAG: M24 family metallopeptidase [Actinobacteria bacterium]|nr:M24 family metallopeptidase [Actinomycetota bacterium]